ncbi:MarR family winged helix-turn-helix transcriptional regulator [Sanguibacter sp. A247]|uniref:MarR family winged helix-turn-helix transcriptional regulator n=1 Tax=unclassified Sanguibacter TaxID=2645534 RepID=UPI003FD70D88
MRDNGKGTPDPYWYSDDDVLQLLSALRQFRVADTGMRRRTARAMDMNESDMAALQLVIAAQRHGTIVTPNAVARHLDISTASTTKLVDRLEESGYLIREAHPTDRRSVALVPTERAHDEVRSRLAEMHSAMERVARTIPASSRHDAAQFLRGIAQLLDEQEGIRPLL